MLGISTVDLVIRTAVPAGGLLILILIVTAFSGILASSRQTPSSLPEAPSPRRINISRDISTADSDVYPPSRYEDLKEQVLRSSTTFLQPRKAPDGGLPTIARPITGVAGVGGLPVQGVLFPPPRAGTFPVADRPRHISIHVAELQSKKNFFDFSKGAGSGGKVSIGHPVLQQNVGQNPLNKIATIDLQEAARAEKQRRTQAMKKKDSILVAKRSAPRPSEMSPEEVMKRSVSVKRKEVGSVYSTPDAAGPMGGTSLQPVNNSSTTSAELSPGVEEIRRRSPRYPSQETLSRGMIQQPPLPPAPEQASSFSDQYPSGRGLASSVLQPRPQSPPTPEDTRTQILRSQSVRTTIRPSRKLASPKNSPPPEPAKTPLQRRPTNGLPPGPKARRLDIVKEAGAQARQTVMFVNNIVYDDPNEVQRIIDGAGNEQTVKMPPKPHSHERAKSVVHRPRPIPRKPSVTPAEVALLMHRRSKSAGAATSRKSILRPAPGSPGQLPPLPPPPKSAGVSSRPHPNNTKSMTVDEKMGLFFPRPPSSSSSATRAGSQVPDLPPLPPVFFEPSTSPTSAGRQHSNRTTKTSSVGTDSIFEVEEIIHRAPNNSRFSPSTVRNTNTMDDVNHSWLPGTSDTGFRQTKASQTSSSQGSAVGKRGSSPVLPVRGSGWTDTTDSSTYHDNTSHWNSDYSAEVAVGISAERHIARATDIKRAESQSQRDRKQVPAIDEPRYDEEVISFILEPSSPQSGFGNTAQAGDAFLKAGDLLMRPERASQYQWHRRVGDECPTFSNRKERVRSRTMSPPAPLLLRSPVNPYMQAVFIRAAEPSPPLESPEQAIRKIQEQLEKFEHSDRDSNGSREAQRLALLESLEKEMGLQENRWHEMQNDLGRHSVSSIGTVSVSSKRNSRADRDSVTLDQQTSIAQGRRASRPSQVQILPVSKRQQLSRASTWQQKLVQAEMEYMDNSMNALHRDSIDYLVVSVPKSNLGSPTPPDSENSDYDEESPKMASGRIDAVVAVAQAEVSPGEPQRINTLWVPARATERRSVISSLLWTPPTNKPTEQDYELPGLLVRPAQRKEWLPLQITSTQLWRKPLSKERSNTGLWRPVWATFQPQPSIPSRPTSVQSPTPSQPPKNPRPVTQRPPRRTRRVTLLPDIVENPEPLPDKRGTLGIFQFPWGERSDTASIRPRMTMAMPGTMSSQTATVAMDVRSSRLDLNGDDYSSSFFDDYEDEGSDAEDSGDDGFDETTLWEIASLLKTDGLPSKNSLFPPPLEREVAHDYSDDSSSEYDSDSEHSIVIGLEDEGVFFERTAPLQSGLWQAWDGSHEVALAWGLPTPQDWEQNSAIVDVPMLKRRKLGTELSIESSHLWRREAKVAFPAGKTWMSVNGLAKIPRPTSETDTGRKHSKNSTTARLWSPPALSPSTDDTCRMFKPDPRRTDYRTTSEQPAALNMPRRHRSNHDIALEKLTSSSLWAKTRQSAFRLWFPVQVPYYTEAEGLFTANRNRVNFRTTTQEPAALRMPRRARPSNNAALARLTSSSLWTATRQSAVGMWSPMQLHHYIESKGLFTANRNRPDFRSTTQAPAALNMARRPRMNGNQPLERLNSVTLWKRTKNPKLRFQQMSHGMWSPAPVRDDHDDSPGLYVSGRKRSDCRTPSAEPAAKFMLRQLRPAENKPLAKLNSTNLWTPYPPRRQLSRNWIMANPLLRRDNYSEGDWATALEEAVQASYPSSRRRHAKEAEWDAALQEAIHLSTRTETQIMNEKSDFIRAQIQSPEQEQPRQVKELLWTKPDTVQQTESKAAMWTLGAITSVINFVTVEQPVAGQQQLRRRKTVAPTDVVKVLAEQGMWRPLKQDEERDWMGGLCQRK